MAFVFSSQRWKQNLPQESYPGPGTYKITLNSESQDQQVPIKIFKGRAFPKPIKSGSQDQLFLSLIHKDNQKGISGKQRPHSHKVKNFSQIQKSCKDKKIGMLTIKSMQEKEFIKQAQKSPEVYENFINFEIQHTPASIKKQITQNFYIGPANDKKYGKIIHTPSTKYPKVFHSMKNKSKTHQSQNNQWQDQQQAKVNAYGSVFKQIKQNLRRKLATSGHPFRKKRPNQLQNKEDQNRELPTRISDGSDSSFSSQFETPGPGYYDIQKKPATTKKSMMFTEYQQRFEGLYTKNSSNPNQNSTSCQISRNQKRTKSRALQSKVGFGTAISAKTQKNEKQLESYKFYQDNKSLQSKALLHKIQDELKPGFFCFKNNQKLRKKQEIQRVGQAYLESIEMVNELCKTVNTQNTYQFKSVNHRQNCPINQTANVDYSGQDYKTISKNVQADQINQNHYFSSSSNRFKYPEKQMPKIKSQLQIKHQLVNDFNGYRQRSQETKKKDIKGYTFCQKQEGEEGILNRQNTPGPTQYSHNKEWITRTFNKKFKLR